jgi:hypothetical protein
MKATVVKNFESNQIKSNQIKSNQIKSTFYPTIGNLGVVP